jgi:hypothetical protein
MTDINQAGDPPGPPPSPTSGVPSVPLPATGSSSKGMAIASLVCSLVGIVLFGPILGIIAIVLGAVARKNMRAANNYDGYGIALAGIIIGAVEAVITILIVIFVIASINH